MEATGTVDALRVAGDVATASVALAGLILVFLGTISTAFDSYQKSEQSAVRGKYQRRAWFAFVGFVLALISGGLAIAGKWLDLECAALAGTVILFVALFWVLVASVFVVMEIK
jgi:hypothetical protein